MFDRKNGYFIIKVKEDIFYMRSHPKDMLSSMKNKGHDMFMAFRDTEEKEQFPLSITDLENYIKEVE